MSLSGKTIAVTGAFGTLGNAVVKRLLERGATVAAIDLADAPRDAKALGAAHLYGGVDLGDEAAARAVFAAIAGSHGGLHGLVNVAGGFAWEKFEGGALETWDRMYRMNLRSAVCASQGALAHLAEGGRIVNVGALAGNRGEFGKAAYAASKAGVARFTESLAEELKGRGITVNAVLPSILDTPPNRADMPDADFGAWVQPAQLAAVIAFLLSDEASAITGALLPVAGKV